MEKVILEMAIRAKIATLSEPVEFCDESGNVLGTYTPFRNGKHLSSQQPPLSQEELAKRDGEPDYSTAEVLAHLEKL